MSNLRIFFTPSTSSRTRGHPYKLFKSHCCTDTRRIFFPERVINVWNQLLSTVNFSSLACFRRSILRVLILLIILNVIRLFCFYCQCRGKCKLMLLCLYSYLPWATISPLYYALLYGTCSLLVHHLCTRLERINDDDDDDEHIVRIIQKILR